MGRPVDGVSASKGLPTASICSLAIDLRVIDYKSGYPPEGKRALQVPIYAPVRAGSRWPRVTAAPWSIDEASYVAFSGKRTSSR